MKRSRAILISICLAVASMSPAHSEELKVASGKVVMIDVRPGASYGATNDEIFANVIVKLDQNPKESYGFLLEYSTLQLKEWNKGKDFPHPNTSYAMYELLRDAFNHGWAVTLVYLQKTPGGGMTSSPTNFELIRLNVNK